MAAVQFEVKNLKKSYGAQVAISDLSLSVKSGSMNFLLGANCSGKSTLLKCLAGHEYWDDGEIFYNGHSRKNDFKNFNSGLHFISEEILPPLTSLDNLRGIYKEVYGQWDEEFFKRFLNWSGLTFQSHLGGMSRGQRVQALLSLSLAVRPEIILIDEATAVLDPYMRNRFMMELDFQNRESGLTVIIATNIATELKSLKGRLLIMKNGKLASDRSSEVLSEGFKKIRVTRSQLEFVAQAGFSFIGANTDGSVTCIGRVENVEKFQLDFQDDNRLITAEEVFIFFSDRNI